MNDDQTKKAMGPCDDLYIYYLQGHVGETPLRNSDFIGNWEEDEFSFLFFARPADEAVEAVVAARPDLVLLDRYHMAYEEWLGETLKPFRVGRFFIAPPWDPAEAPDGTERIHLDPGVVFGTGTHPTTCDCLALLQELCQTQQIGTALDLGTGTGLLALGAARLGCGRVLALDFNRLAARTARRNVVRNGLENRVITFQGRAEDFIDVPADLLIANIHYDVMKELIGSEGFLQKKWFILSGLLRSQAREIFYTLLQYPVEIMETRTRDGIWHTFYGRAFS